MRRIKTGTRPLPEVEETEEGDASAVFHTITIDPRPEMTPEDFRAQLLAAFADWVDTDLIVAVEISGRNVTVVTLRFAMLKWALKLRKKLPEFEILIPLIP